MRRAVLGVITVLGWTAAAAADPPGGAPEAGALASCPPGQVVTAATTGHCCWPEQVWSSMRNACVGDPRCPEGWRADGERCVAGGAPPPSPYGAPPIGREPAPAPSPYGAPPTLPRLTAPPSSPTVMPSPLPAPIAPAAVTETVSSYRRPRLGRAGYVWGSISLVLGAADVGLGGYLLSLDTSFARRGAPGLVCVLSGVLGVSIGIAGLATAGRPRPDNSGGP